MKRSGFIASLGAAAVAPAVAPLAKALPPSSPYRVVFVLHHPWVDEIGHFHEPVCLPKFNHFRDFSDEA
jgi:hypothetical protein